MKVIHDEEFDDYLFDAVSIFPEQLDEEFIRLPADLAYFNSKVSKAMKEFLVSREGEKATHARVWIEIKEGRKAAGEKATEKEVDALVALDPSAQAATLRRIEAEVEHAKLKGLADAVKTKKDALVSIGANYRAERSGDPSIRR